jgi:hypothetical protein
MADVPKDITAAAEIQRLRAEVERLTAKAAEWDQRDGIDGAACSAIREMLDSLGVPRAAFIDDHVANAYLHGKAEAMERAAQIAERYDPDYWGNGHTARLVQNDIAAAIRAEAMERAAQIAYEKADEHLRIWEDDNILPEVAIEHKARADALHDLAEAIRQEAIRAEASKKGGAT